MIREFAHKYGYALPALGFAIILSICNAYLDPSFLDPASWGFIMAVAAPFVLVAIAVAPVLISGNGGIDLSVGPTAGLTNALIVTAFVPAGLDTPATLLPLVVLTGALVGSVNGLLVSVLRVPAIIATLGTYLIVNGVTLQILPVSGGMAADWVTDLSGSWGWFPLPLLTIAAVLLIWLPFRRSAFGRNLLATGGDRRAAYTSGIDVVTVRFIAFVLCGVFAAAAGFAFTVGLGSGDPNVATPYTLIGIAGAVVGGVNLAGGRGGLAGAAAGGAVLFLLQNLLSLAHVSAFYAQVAYGAALLAGLMIGRCGEMLRLRSA